MLMKFNDEAHLHLISLLATYEQFNKFYLIFPCAEADLETYWKAPENTPRMDHATVKWMADQCKGLADGLAQIHRWTTPPKRSNADRPTCLSTTANGQRIGRHGDIKPQNVLWFQNPKDGNDRGTLKITDFGLTEFKASHSTFSKPDGTKAAVSPSYRPPEYDLNKANGRSHDIWALGCVYLDFIAWLLGGWDLVDEFAQSRVSKDPNWCDLETDTYFQIVENHGIREAVVKPAVGRVRPQVQHQRIIKSHSI